MSTQPHLSPEYIAEYSGGKLIALSISLIVIIVFFVSLRFYSRWLSKTKYGLDDYLVLLSLVLLVGESGLAICEHRHLFTFLLSVSRLQACVGCAS